MAKPNHMEDLREALLATGLVLPLKSTTKGSTYSFLCRSTGQDRNWVQAVEAILNAFDGRNDVELHLGRQYVLKNGKMAAGWFISFTCSKQLLPEVVGVFKTTLESLEFEEEPEPEEGEEEEQPRRQARGYQSPYREMDPRLHAQIAGVQGAREFRGRTTSPPRAMEREPELEVDPTRDVRLKVTMDRIKTRPDGKKVRVIHQTIPLPHVYKEINTEKANGMGVLGGADSTPKILRNRA